MKTEDSLEVLDATAGELKVSSSERASTHDPSYAWAWLLWRERRFIGRIVLAGIIAGAVLSLLMPSRYTAKAQLMPPDANGSGGMAALLAGSVADKAGGLGSAAADLMGFKSSGALFVGILKSRTVEDRLVEGFDLRRVYRLKYWADARTELADRTEIVEDRKSGIISISVTDRDRGRAQQLAVAYVDELNRVVSTSAMSAASRERHFIEQQMSEVRKEMNDSAHALADFSSKNGTVDIKEQARALLDAAAGVQGELIAAEAEMNGLRAIYTDNNVRVRSVSARITELKRQLHQLGGNSTASRREPNTDYPNIRQLPQLSVTFEDMYRRNKIADAVYEALVQQYELSKLQEAKDTPQVQMLDAPDKPELKSFPPRTLIVLGCALLSLLFATGWLFGAEAWASMQADDPGKQLAAEISRSIAAHKFWRTRQVIWIRGNTARVRARFMPTRTAASGEAQAD
jgi:capsule polysaccharide export protein KpsE/RkpR